MTVPFKLSDWNAIVQAINNLITRSGSSTSKLAVVTAPHRWSVADILAARAALFAACANGPTFRAATVKWSQAIVDELNQAIADCESCNPMAENGLTFDVPVTSVPVSGTPGAWHVLYGIALDGLQLGRPGITNRVWLATAPQNGAGVMWHNTGIMLCYGTCYCHDPFGTGYYYIYSGSAPPGTLSVTIQCGPACQCEPCT